MLAAIRWIHFCNNAPEGKHTLSLWCHQFPYKLAQCDIDVEREKLAERMTELAPNYHASVMANEVYLPVDIERVYGISGRPIVHSELMPDQLLWNRPIPGYSGHNDMVARLYLSGAGTHPGDDVNAAPDHTAARAVLADVARRQFDRARA